MEAMATPITRRTRVTMRVTRRTRVIMQHLRPVAVVRRHLFTPPAMALPAVAAAVFRRAAIPVDRLDRVGPVAHRAPALAACLRSL